ncbi:MAG: hypothetical protein QXP70_06610 [Methanomassiliicoccales archaeon]
MDTIAGIRERKPGIGRRFRTSASRYLKDTIIIVFIFLLLAGITLFEVSSIFHYRQLIKINSGNGSFTIGHNQTVTVYFSILEGDITHVVVKTSQAMYMSYSIYTYAYVNTFYGSSYQQSLVANGNLNGTTSNIYLPVQYQDNNYFINLTLVSQGRAQVSVAAYAEFYIYQPFQIPLEIAGVSLMILSIVLIAVRATSIHERIP